MACLLRCKSVDWSISSIIAVCLIGLVGGCLGGMLGLGGSVFIIPALSLALGPNQHLYQAAALTANIFVAVAATRRHLGKGTIQPDILPWMVVSAGAMAVVGVLASNQIEPRPLAALFGLFLCYAAVAECISLALRRPDAAGSERTRGHATAVALTAGWAGGFAAGLLGIGGGAVMVPILRRFGRLPVRQAVATSSAAMISACIVGAISKNMSLDGLQDFGGQSLTIGSSLSLAALLSPMAMLGGTIGAALVYRLPVVVTRGVLAALLAFAGYRMLSIGGQSLLDALRSGAM